MNEFDDDRLEVRKELDLQAAPERVWRALTDPEQLGSWFSDAVSMEPDRDRQRGWLEWRKHGRFAFEVLESKPPSRLVWRWARDADTDLEDGPTTVVEWTLQKRPGGGTRLLLVEMGFSAESYRDQNDEGWDAELGDLRQVLHG